jgi:hypothetical protein
MRVILLLRARVSVSLRRLSSLNPIADPAHVAKTETQYANTVDINVHERYHKEKHRNNGMY